MLNFFFKKKSDGKSLEAQSAGMTAQIDADVDSLSEVRQVSGKLHFQFALLTGLYKVRYS